MSCTTSSHSSAPREILQKPLSSPHKSLMPHPCSSLVERGPEMKNLPGTSNSSQPLLLHRTLLQAHFSRGKKAEKSLRALPLLLSRQLCSPQSSHLAPRGA